MSTTLKWSSWFPDFDQTSIDMGTRGCTMTTDAWFAILVSEEWVGDWGMNNHQEYLQPLMRGILLQFLREENTPILIKRGRVTYLQETNFVYGVEFQYTNLCNLPGRSRNTGSAEQHLVGMRDAY